MCVVVGEGRGGGAGVPLQPPPAQPSRHDHVRILREEPAQPPRHRVPQGTTTAFSWGM